MAGSSIAAVADHVDAVHGQLLRDAARLMYVGCPPLSRGRADGRLSRPTAPVRRPRRAVISAPPRRSISATIPARCSSAHTATTEPSGTAGGLVQQLDQAADSSSGDSSTSTTPASAAPARQIASISPARRPRVVSDPPGHHQPVRRPRRHRPHRVDRLVRSGRRRCRAPPPARRRAASTRRRPPAATPATPRCAPGPAAPRRRRQPVDVQPAGVVFGAGGEAGQPCADRVQRHPDRRSPPRSRPARSTRSPSRRRPGSAARRPRRSPSVGS